MTTFLSSDWHLGHANIIAYDRRPFRDVAEMEVALIRNYRAAVNDNDRVLFLGDMFFKATKNEAAAIMSQLPGQKSLVLGNHDRHSKTWFRDVGFVDVVKLLELDLGKLGAAICVHNPLRTAKLPGDPYVLHGHRHSTGPMPRGKDAKWFDVGVTTHNYFPVRLEDAIGLLTT
jgi:calcineurin-like phosphoesterase family protein